MEPTSHKDSNRSICGAVRLFEQNMKPIAWNTKPFSKCNVATNIIKSKTYIQFYNRKHCEKSINR